MPVHVKLSTTLRDHVPGYVPADGLLIEPEPPATALSLARQLGLPPEKIKIIMINGKHAAPDAPLAEGDRVAYFPAVGGG